MKRTTVMLPLDLRARVIQRAAELDVSMGEYIRRSLRSSLEEIASPRRTGDALFRDSSAFDGRAPIDLGEHHDRHLYGDPE